MPPQIIYNAVARAAAQKEVMKVYENIRRIVEDSPDAMLVLGQDSTIRFANRAARLLFSTPALEGLNFGFILADKGEKQELDVPRADGTVITAEMYVNETIWYGEPSLVATFRDIHVEERLQNALEGTIRIISRMVEFKDSYTSGHQQRVAKLAVAMAREMGLFSEDQLHGIHVASMIHDMGKIAVPIEILNKSSQLSDHEFAIIKQHPIVGYNILKEIDFPWPVAQMVHQHHEKMDGSGYPQGLKGEEILLEARILCVADVVEAMASHRPYRPALGLEKALEEISCNSGKLYDPEVVKICLRLFREKGFSF